MENFYRNKKILVTGAAGTIGKELIKQIINYSPKEIKAIDNNESGLFFLNELYRNHAEFNGFFASIRDADRIKYLCKDVDIILHCAALKHVGINELSPGDAVKTNADGTLNVVQAALESEQVSRVIYTSSDKAVNSPNVMGTTKLLGEKLMTAAASMKSNKNIVFASTRFGNVIGSRGSVIPIFYKQIAEGKNITLTDKAMTRFFMTIKEAASLVMEASMHAKGGEVFVTKMPVMRILDLATALNEIVAPLYGRPKDEIKIEYIGTKPGEKLFEELMTEEEKNRAVELQNMFAIRPAINPIYDSIDFNDYETLLSQAVDKPYISHNEPCMSIQEIKKFLIEERVLQSLELENTALPDISFEEHLGNEGINQQQSYI